MYLKRDHFKCHLCGPKQEWVFYKDYPSMAKHFEKTHYACKFDECKQRGFIVYKDKSELDNHLYKEHAIGNGKVVLKTKDQNTHVVIKDNEGVDCIDQLLSLRKKQKTEELDQKFVDNFDIRVYMRMRKVDPNAPPVKARYNKKLQDNIKQAKRGKKPRKGSKVIEEEPQEDEGYADIDWTKEMPLCEDIKMVELEKLPPSDMKEFEGKCLRDIIPAKFEKLKERIFMYNYKKITENDLFNGFQDIFGNKDAFEFFAYYIKTCSNETYYTLEDELIYRCNKLRTEHLSILKNNNTFTDFFGKIEQKIVENIFSRIENGVMKCESPAKKNQMVLFQYFGVLKQMQKGEVVKLKYINRFLESQKSMDALIDSLFILKDEFQAKISEINNVDIIMLFLYFNIGNQKLKGLKVRLSTSKINPNLNKLFLRHFPDYAKDNKLKTSSDEEDYEVEVKRPEDLEEETSKDHNTKKVITNTKTDVSNVTRKKYEAKNLFVTNKEEKITENTVRVDDLSNKFDFPMIDEDMGFMPTKKPVGGQDDSSGWNDPNTFLYKRSDLSKKEMNTFFPSLGDVAGSLQNQGSTQPSKPVVKKKGKKMGKAIVENDPIGNTLNSLYGGDAFGADAWDPIGGLYGGGNVQVPMEKQVPKSQKQKIVQNSINQSYKAPAPINYKPIDSFTLIQNTLEPLKQDNNFPGLGGATGGNNGKQNAILEFFDFFQ